MRMADDRQLLPVSTSNLAEPDRLVVAPTLLAWIVRHNEQRDKDCPTETGYSDFEPRHLVTSVWYKRHSAASFALASRLLRSVSALVARLASRSTREACQISSSVCVIVNYT